MLLRRVDVEWIRTPLDAELEGLVALGAEEVAIMHKRVKDGTLRAVRSCELDHRWHLSVSHWNHSKRRRPRFPTWAEIADAVYDLLPANVNVVAALPPPEMLVAGRDNTLHVWETRSTDAVEGLVHEFRQLHPPEEAGGTTGG